MSVIAGTRRRDRIGVALMPAAILAVHDLRYRLAFGARAPAQLEAQGHAYLHAVVPFAVLAAALGAGAWIARAARAWSPKPGSLPRVWALAFAALLAIYTGQELLEGALAPGHPAGWQGVFGDGGLWAIPAAAAAAAVLALVLHGASRALELVAHAHPRIALPRPAAERPPTRPGPARFATRLLEHEAPSRAPPMHTV